MTFSVELAEGVDGVGWAVAMDLAFVDEEGRVAIDGEAHHLEAVTGRCDIAGGDFGSCLAPGVAGGHEDDVGAELVAGALGHDEMAKVWWVEGAAKDDERRMVRSGHVRSFADGYGTGDEAVE